MPYYDEFNNELSAEQIRTYQGKMYDDHMNPMSLDTLLMYKFDTAASTAEYSSAGETMQGSSERQKGGCLGHVITIAIIATTVYIVSTFQIAKYDPYLALVFMVPIALATLIYVPILGRAVAGPHPSDLLLYFICGLGVVTGIFWMTGTLGLVGSLLGLFFRHLLGL